MRFLSKSSALAIALAIGGGTLLAQPAPQREKPVTSLSPDDMQGQLDTMAARIKADARQVMHLRELARKQKDVIKLTCVNDKLVQLKAQQNIFGAGQVQLQAAITDGQGDRFGLFSSVRDTAEGVRKLREEAEACLGEGDLSPSESAVDVTSPDIPDDPTQTDDTFDPGLEAPGYASPFR